MDNRAGDFVPVAVVDLGLGTKQLLLTSLVGKVSSGLVAVLLGLEERDQVDTRPHLLAGELTNYHGVNDLIPLSSLTGIEKH